MNSLNAIVSDIRNGKNLDKYVAILLGLVLSVLSILGVVRFQFVAAGVLVVVSFVVWTSVESRHEISELKGLIRGSQLSNQLVRFAEYPEAGIGSQVRQAREICLSGVSLFRFVPLYFADIKEALRNGAVLKIVIADPDSAAVDMASFRSDDGLSPQLER